MAEQHGHKSGHGKGDHRHADHGHADHHHVELPFWRKYIFSTDHKTIGIQYGLTALSFLFFGFCLMMLMRWQLAFPGKAIPVIGGLFGENTAPNGIMLPDFYNHSERCTAPSWCS
jgi:cytochrome c oxidase subunit 1